MPPYPGLRHSMEVQLGNEEKKTEKAENADDWAAQYQAYLHEKEGLGNKDKTIEKDVIAKKETEIPEGGDWALQYAMHCEEKEKEFIESNKPKE